ncbi:hypothetical protein F7725_024501, partial [Dissostichus mawsoni]
MSVFPVGDPGSVVIMSVFPVGVPGSVVMMSVFPVGDPGSVVRMSVFPVGDPGSVVMMSVFPVGVPGSVVMMSVFPVGDPGSVVMMSLFPVGVPGSVVIMSVFPVGVPGSVVIMSVFPVGDPGSVVIMSVFPVGVPGSVVMMSVFPVGDPGSVVRMSVFSVGDPGSVVMMSVFPVGDPGSVVIMSVFPVGVPGSVVMMSVFPVGDPGSVVIMSVFPVGDPGSVVIMRSVVRMMTTCSEPCSDDSLSDIVSVSSLWWYHPLFLSTISPPLPQAVGLGLDFVKLGGLSGAERMTKYNRLISIEEELSQQGILASKKKHPPPLFQTQTENGLWEKKRKQRGLYNCMFCLERRVCTSVNHHQGASAEQMAEEGIEPRMSFFGLMRKPPPRIRMLSDSEERTHHGVFRAPARPSASAGSSAAAHHLRLTEAPPW